MKQIGAKSLGEVAEDIQMLEIRCRKCSRHGQLNLSWLIEEHGRDTLLPDLAMRIAGDCPNQSGSIYERCSPYFPQLINTN